MASPKSPNPPSTLKKDKKDESFLDKIGTLGRKKKIKEADQLTEEGQRAIEVPTSPVHPDLGPEGYLLEENEERSMMEPGYKNDPKLVQLIEMLTDWVNDVLAEERIIVKDLEEDLYDGLILQKLIEKLGGVAIRELPEVIQSEMGQKQKLQTVLDVINSELRLSWSDIKWNVDTIHSKSLVPILYLLVALARHYNAPIRLPENVKVDVLIVVKHGGKLITRKVVEEITTSNEEMGAKFGESKDAFGTLINHAPEKLDVVKRSLISFANKHLNKINLEVTDLETQFSDGVYLVLLMGLLEGYFVPLYEFHITPETFDQKVHNVTFSFELMQDAKLPKPVCRPEDIVNQDLKSTLKVLYGLFLKYKSASY